MKVCQHCHESYEGAGAKYCDACKPIVLRQQRNEQMRRYLKTASGQAYLRARKKPAEHEESYRKARLERLAKQDDGTVTRKVVMQEFARKHCPYCGEAMQKGAMQLDHMQPLALGGPHSAANVLGCCATCNGRKSGLSFLRWLSTLAPQQQGECRAIWIKKNGAPPEQAPLAMPDPATVQRNMRTLQERTTARAIAEAKRARAAWFKRDAPDEWMAAYWEGMGEPWRNQRLSDGERYRVQYQHDPSYRAKEIERQRMYKQRTTRTWAGGAYKVVGRRCGRGGSTRVA